MRFLPKTGRSAAFRCCDSFADRRIGILRYDVGMPQFRGFDDSAAVIAHSRNLPHWRQPGATYFVTFRQADSLPRSVLDGWRMERETWLRAHAIEPAWERPDPARFQAAYAAVSPEERRNFERHLFHEFHLELDKCHGSCVLRRGEQARRVGSALRHFDGHRLWLGDHVIMPNHVHALIQPCAGFDLSENLYSVKRFSSRQIGDALRGNVAPGKPIPALARGKFWQAESYDRIVRDEKELAAFRRYIAKNPEVAKLREGEFLYFAAEWLDEFAPRA